MASVPSVVQQINSDKNKYNNTKAITKKKIEKKQLRKLRYVRGKSKKYSTVHRGGGRGS